MNHGSANPLTPAQDLAEGFAAHIGRWAVRLGCDAAQRRALECAARALSLATSEGHVCLELGALSEPGAPGAPDDEDAATLNRTLLASGLVGTPAAPGALPLVLDDDGRLYLHRYFDFERRLARRLVRAGAAAAAPVDAATARLLRELFQADATPAGGANWQQVAAALALRQRLTVISGGPGTGKTSTVVNLLACLLAQDPGCRIALAAPTGKAAARMTEALRGRAAHLPPALRERLPAEASTVHRLLGARPGGRFAHDAGHPLALDALVVDEASMLDLALATRLLEAVPDTARLILLGDKDQLAAVESGAVFAELSADPSLSEGTRDALAALCGMAAERLRPPVPARASALQDAVVWFTRNYRFAADSGIGRLAADIRGGRTPAALDWLREGDDAELRWLDDGGAAPGAATLAACRDGHAPFLDSVLQSPADAAAALQAFGRFSVLCALREGPRGMQAVNEHLTRHARERLAPLAAVPGGDLRSPWFAGRPVMVLHNDPMLRLFNGDVGLTLPDAAGELKVFFPDAAGGLRAIAPVRMPAHQTAFAMTVHKAQGSEFDRVLLLLPAQRSRVLTRELLYTAVTRARRQVTLAGPAEVLAAAMQAPTRRHSGLLARLREARLEARGSAPPLPG